MDRRTFLSTAGMGSATYFLGTAYPQLFDDLSVGIIGLDTSHSPAFTKIINQNTFPGIRVTHAYPHGSRTIESSYSRIPRYTEEVKNLGVTVVSSIDELLRSVDVVLLETNDGRLHLEQAEAVFKAGKRVFIDKPLAASLKDAIQIYQLSEKFRVPFFSCSSLRFSPTTVAVAKGEKIGQVLHADIYSPAKIEPTHPDLFWYGIHGVESLYTVMGTGCIEVRRFYEESTDVVIGQWPNGRIGTFRGLRGAKTGYGGTAYGTEGVSPAGVYEGYEHLVEAIIQFFRTGIPPVKKEETLEIFAFMAAAEESKRKKGRPVKIAKFWTPS